MYVIKVYDPTGRFVDTTGRKFPFRWLAERDRKRYNMMSHITVPYEGRQVPLCNYVVEKT